MTIKWPALRVTAEAHTVFVRRGRLAGFLIRDSASRVQLGYVWSAGSVWGWRAADGEHYGERSTQVAAIEVLRDTYDAVNVGPKTPRAVRAPRPLIDLVDAPTLRADIVDTVTDTGARERRTVWSMPPSTLDAPVHVQQIVWGNAVTDLTAKIAAAFKKAGK